MTIKFSYEIISVNPEARCMEVIYTAENRKPIHVSARLPYEDETLEGVIVSFSPLNLWLEQDRAVQTIAVGVKGEIDPEKLYTTKQTVIEHDIFEGVSGEIPVVKVEG